jgi:hypothetical protein
VVNTYSARLAFVVLGMHRSGTSSVAGTLAHLGARPPNNLISAEKQNERGFWESRAVITLNEAIFKSLGQDWDDVSSVALNELDGSELSRFEHEAGVIIDSEFENANVIVLKDPRICLVLPIWERALTAKNYDIKIVLPFRDAGEVVASLWARNNLPHSTAALLWLRYIIDAELSSRRLSRYFFSWHDLLKDWQSVIDKLSFDLNTSVLVRSAESAAAVSAFLSSDLRHQKNAIQSNDDILNSWIKIASAAMKLLITDPADENAMRLLDQLKIEIDKWTLVFGDSVARTDLKNLISDYKKWTHDLRAGNDWLTQKVEDWKNAAAVATLISNDQSEKIKDLENKIAEFGRQIQ